MRAETKHQRNFRLAFGFVIALVFSALFFSPNSLAVTSDYFNNVSISARVSFFKPNANTGLYDNVGGPYTYDSSLVSFDSESGTGSYSIYTYDQPSTCNNKCWLFIHYLIVTPKSSVNGSIVYPSLDYPYTHIWLYSAENFYVGNPYLNITTTYPNFHYLSPQGRDAWINNNLNNHLSCIDQGESVCNITFWNNNVELDPSVPYNGITINMKTSLFENLNTHNMRVSQWPYNLNTHNYIFNNDGGPLYFIPRTEPLVFYVKAWQDDLLDDGIDDGEDLAETTPDFDIEYDTIQQNGQNAQNSADSLNVGFQVPWIFSSWFSLFVDSTCVNIPNIQGLIHSSESRVCTPWSSNLRTILTPVFAMLASLLAFGFVIRWLNRGSSQEIEQ